MVAVTVTRDQLVPFRFAPPSLVSRNRPMALVHGRTGTRTVSHLLLTGYNPLSPPASSQAASWSRQAPSNPSLTPVPLNTWLSQLGREQDTFSTATPPVVTGVASSTGHSLLSYRNDHGVDRVIALGRNESGQLGIGFASQEGTRGLVEGFEGEQVLKVRTAVQASYLLVQHDATSNHLYSIGNLSRGRLSHPNLFSRSHTPDEQDQDEPRQNLLPRATLIDTTQLDQQSGKIVDIETGYEHVLVLTESGDIYGTGCNTDGQLGLGPESISDIYTLTQIPLSSEITEREGGVAKIFAGGDTSGLITHSGKVYTWGNSEYAQAGHGRKIDQISSPLLAATRLALDHESKGFDEPRRIVDYQCGGSFSMMLDDRNNVYTTGYGALGYKVTPPSQSYYNPVPTRVPSLSSSDPRSRITRIRAAFGYAVAISDDSNRLFGWGLNNDHGRLGIGALGSHPPSSTSSSSRGEDTNRALRVERHVVEPRELELPVRELGLDEDGIEWNVGKVELGEEGMWVELRAEQEIDFERERNRDEEGA
ncbi:RCC1 domain-containing protein [Sporobolomyces koalae]|uniref:RCC1 domain-containing protein n=1 Tax=Sporobolomyces koalae TaxID=500713 RepID=UPI003181E31F